MAFSFLSSQAKRKDQIVAIDLGARTTKAVHIVRKGDKFNFVGYTMQDAPIFEKAMSPELLADHLKSVNTALGNKAKQVVFVIGIHDSVLRPAELPAIPVPDMRLMLKFNSKNYLQQDYPDHIFDCYIMPPPAGTAPEAPKPNAKAKVLVGGAKRQYLEDLQTAAKSAGLVATEVVPSHICPANAFEMAFPDIFSKEVVALVDLGYKNSTISILNSGEFALHRVVGIGGYKLTESLAETMNISFAEAEGIKVGLPEEVQTVMQGLLMPLGRELRASIDFFEHQADKTVGQIFVSGGSARSQFVVDTLQSELMVQCKGWNPASFLGLELPPQQIGEVEQVAPQLAIAIGGAMSAF